MSDWKKMAFHGVVYCVPCWTKVMSLDPDGKVTAHSSEPHYNYRYNHWDSEINLIVFEVKE